MKLGFSIGDRIGQFRVVREIGHGGMGSVYEVVAGDDATHLALKAFTLVHGNREFLKKRFLAEAKILSRLNHPRLVHVHELGIDESSGTPYYVMDLVRSAAGGAETLEDVRKAGKVTEARALRWLADIREGLEWRLAYLVGQTVTNQTEGDVYSARRARCEIGWFGQGAKG